MNYSELSDFEINKLVAKAINPNFTYVCTATTGSSGMTTNLPNYCNNPSDAWPIIQDSRMCVNCYSDNGKGDYWEASSYDSMNNNKKWECAQDDKNPLRLAMIVYLMMKDAESEV